MPEPGTNLESLASPAELRRAPVVENYRGLGALTDKLSAFAEGKIPRWWLIAFIPSAFCAAVVLPAMLVYQISTGVGVWGNRAPVMWGWDIVNFIWWIGIAHAGTLFSAMLFLTRQHWRTTIGRAAEAMTVFSV
ncbi:MAG TPA: hydrogenase, partial [Verrucomicrobiae bacterium]|nr:hydrogenase [Verrucomicrobiae bacterium]